MGDTNYSHKWHFGLISWRLDCYKWVVSATQFLVFFKKSELYRHFQLVNMSKYQLKTYQIEMVDLDTSDDAVATFTDHEWSDLNIDRNIERFFSLKNLNW